MRVLSLARQGRVGEAGAMLDELVVNRPGIGTSDDGTLIHRDARFLEAAVLAAHEEAVKLLYRRLTDCAAFTTGAYGPTCVARHLGAAAAFLGEPDNARSHYQTALDVAGSMGFRPEIALTRLQLAELLLDHYPEERSEALDHLAFAVPEFREMNMQPSLERVVALQERAASQPVKAPAYPDGLSQREVEVLRLIAAGKTDREIAEELVISSRTVNNHVRSILNKTAVANRTESATYASRKGLA
jgi:DNA-binding CsgD family transcriptional regulator